MKVDNYQPKQDIESRLCQLNGILTHLKIHITNVCTLPDFQPESMQKDLTGDCLVVRLLLDYNIQLSESEQALLAKINKLSNLLILMIEERQRIRIIFDRTTRTLQAQTVVEEANKISDASDKKISFEVLTQSDISKGPKTNRLQDHQVLILNEWYGRNKKHPYVDEDSLKYLIEKTRLSETQVRNWYVRYFMKFKKLLHRLTRIL